MMRNGYSEVNGTDADAHFTGRLPEMALSGVSGEQVRRFLVERANLLREPQVGRLDFSHRTFQEFLAARAALKESDLGLLLQNAHDDQWRETLIAAAGLASKADCKRLLEGLLERGREATGLEGKPFYLLVLACLETCVELEPAVRRRGQAADDLPFDQL
jgi:hypothetical protein